MLETVTYSVDGPVATLDLHRPHAPDGGVSRRMATQISERLAEANDDPAVHVVRLRGDRDAFESERDLHAAANRIVKVYESRSWDAMADVRAGRLFADTCMSLWRSPKPVVAQVYGRCIGFGSDLVLCSDLILCADDCRIGYSAARGFGAPTTAMWFYRVGLERAKRLLLTGDALDGRTAVEWGLASGSYPAADLDRAAIALCRRVAEIPPSQLQINKLVVNAAVEALGLPGAQTLGTLLDGVARNLPEVRPWIERAAEDADAAMRERDEPFGDHTAGGRTVSDSLLD